MTALLEAENLVKHFVAKRSAFGRPTAFIRAIDGVSFSVERGKTLALVGESGSASRAATSWHWMPTNCAPSESMRRSSFKTPMRRSIRA